MTNEDRWQLLTQRMTSPESWVKFGYYFLIGAALQRRTWYYGKGDTGSELFPNPYYCYIGKPGLGKGLVTGLVTEMLKHHKYELGESLKTNIGKEKPGIFPVLPDSLSFEQLMVRMAEAVRLIPIPGQEKPYKHNSVAFILEEMDSLFKHKTLDVASFLKNAYDCKSFSYETKHQGKFNLRNICLSFLANAQPDFLLEARKKGLFGQGFASRTLFLFETHKRFSTFHNTGFDKEQEDCRATILDWLKKLATLYGEITYDEATYNYLESWSRDVLEIQENKAPARMAEYFARKKVTMLKLAAALHFSENLSFVIPKETFVRAIKILDDLEPSLEAGLCAAGRNELYGFTRRIKELILTRNTISEREIITAFAADMKIEEIKSCLESLELQGVVKTRQEKGIKLYTI